MTDLRQLARGKECQIRIVGVCNHDRETTVLAHLRQSGITGAGIKAPDLLGAWACYDCHTVVDGQRKSKYPKPILKLYFLEGVVRTQAKLIEDGLIHW